MNAINFSPHFWWKSIERAVNYTEFIGNELVDGFNFRDWLNNEIIEHHVIDIYDENLNGPITSNDYRYAVSNDYFFEVFTTSKYGHKVTAKTIEELNKRDLLTDDSEIQYRFKIDDLNHFATLHFQNWLIFDKHFDWVRWQLFFDFIISKLDENKKGLYFYYWSVFLNQVEFQTSFFEDVQQYKKFRDKLDDILKQSNHIETNYQEVRLLKSRISNEKDL